jgi:hypothetical protein
VKCVSKLDDAIVAERTKKRKFHEYLPLKHQHLYEDIESLLENYPSEEGQSAKEKEDELVLTPDGVNVIEYRKLLDSLEEEVPLAAGCLRSLLACWSCLIGIYVCVAFRCGRIAARLEFRASRPCARSEDAA